MQTFYQKSVKKYIAKIRDTTHYVVRLFARLYFLLIFAV